MTAKLFSRGNRRTGSARHSCVSAFLRREIVKSRGDVILIQIITTNRPRNNSSLVCQIRKRLSRFERYRLHKSFPLASTKHHYVTVTSIIYSIWRLNYWQKKYKFFSLNHTNTFSRTCRWRPLVISERSQWLEWPSNVRVTFKNRKKKNVREYVKKKIGSTNYQSTTAAVVNNKMCIVLYIRNEII